MSNEPSQPSAFADLGLPAHLVSVLTAVGYESPSPIQAATIPHLLGGRDVLGQAQTGTGKTAAFALPILARIDPSINTVQALVLTPTRELAIQVAEAFQKYAAHLPNFTVLPVYGGQSYGPQLSALRRGVQVIVATPGRTIDHIERGSLKLDALKTVVLDEADEMLRMGFIDDVETILKTTPATKQVALFSATMPSAISRIASTYLRDPAMVTIAAKTRTATTVRQRVWMVSGVNKLDALTRILEVETFEAMIVFARTKVATEELADKLSARGFAAAALNGDIPQQQRERVVQRLKDGSLDIVVATDVAARGLDVERITHVVNYDVPTDTESYVHRIGRTGRAGRTGDAILFIAPRERGLLKMIERATRQPIENFVLPTTEAVNNQRKEKFKARIIDALAAGGSEFNAFKAMLAEMEEQGQSPALDLAAALATLLQGKQSLFMSPDTADTRRFESSGERSGAYANERPRAASKSYERNERPVERSYTKKPEGEFKPRTPFAAADSAAPRFKPPVADERPRPSFAQDSAERPAPRARAKSDAGKETYRIEVGHMHHVKPGNIVGAIANEAELDSAHIGRIDIRDDHTLIDLPEGMPKHIFTLLQGVWVAGQRLNISKIGAAADADAEAGERKPFKGKKRF